ncbi:MAG: AHH domain-containing protein [Acidiferrobacterales bacterium]
MSPYFGYPCDCRGGDGMSKKLLQAALVILALVSNTAQAGLLGTLAGAAFADHAESSTAGEVVRHPLFSAIAALGADAATRQYLHDQGCGVEAGHLWFCPGIPGRHLLVTEAKDLYIARSEHGKALAKNLAEAREPPQNGCDPHHIVPWRDKRAWAAKYTEPARAFLERCGIDLDSADNGVWLPKRPDAECEGAWHPKLHNNDYYKSLYNDLARAFRNGRSPEEACENVRNELRKIKNGLQKKSYSGVRPPSVTP